MDTVCLLVAARTNKQAGKCISLALIDVIRIHVMSLSPSIFCLVGGNVFIVNFQFPFIGRLRVRFVCVDYDCLNKLGVLDDDDDVDGADDDDDDGGGDNADGHH